MDRLIRDNISNLRIYLKDLLDTMPIAKGDAATSALLSFAIDESCCEPSLECAFFDLKIWAIAMHGRNESSKFFKTTSDILNRLPHSSPAYGWLLVVRRCAPIS